MGGDPRKHDGGPLVRIGATATVGELFAMRVRVHPDRIAVEDAERRWSYAELSERVRRLAGGLAARGVTAGSRLAILSENRAEYLEVMLAAAQLSVMLACQNWRLALPELQHCVDLVAPDAVIASPRHAAKLEQLRGVERPIVLGAAYEEMLAAAPPPPPTSVDPEDPLLLLYTSGTTGLPKGAVISHRAEVVRNLVVRAELGVRSADAFVAWSPLYHMGAVDCSLGTLMSGGTVIVVDGFDRERLARLVAERELGWLLLMPGMVGAFVEELRRARVAPRGIRVCGVMADLVPPADIAEVTRLLQAPFANTFGATETGNPPASANLVPIGVAPTRLSKEQSAYCQVRLVDADDRDVADGSPGELCMRGPTLFSGYFRAPEVNAHDFRGGWFHMGDVFVRNGDGTLDFVDRVKYLIKTGGENVYPAEIERVLRLDPRVRDVAVVRQKDARWGEVPVAFVARGDDALEAGELLARCRTELAGYKQPKRILFIDHDEFPRSTSGKVQRHELEKRLPDHEGDDPA